MRLEEIKKYERIQECISLFENRHGGLDACVGLRGHPPVGSDGLDLGVELDTFLPVEVGAAHETSP